jgi:biotin operon repressor
MKTPKRTKENKAFIKKVIKDLKKLGIRIKYRPGKLPLGTKNGH